MRRRTFLTLSGGALAVSAGCVGTDGEDEESDDGESSAQNTDPNNISSDPGVEPNTSTGSDNDSDNNSNSDGDNNSDNDTDSNASTEPEGQREPDEEDYEIDDENFEETGERDVEERSVDDVEITADAQAHDDGSVTLTGEITNTVDVPLTVDLDVLFYDDAEEYIGATLISVRDIPAGETAEFEKSIGPDELQGELVSIEMEPIVYEVAD